MKTEKIFALLFLIGIAFKIFHIPMAATLVILATGVLACLYFA